MTTRRRMLVFLLIIVALPVVSLAILSLASPTPGHLGVHEGRLSDCPQSPNCVCSQATDESHRVEPIALEAPPAEMMSRLKDVLTQLPRTTIVEERPDYLRAECRSLLFRFVDDLEFLIDTESNLLHVRSASRAGYSDLGVNRQRVERIRTPLRKER